MVSQASTGFCPQRGLLMGCRAFVGLSVPLLFMVDGTLCGFTGRHWILAHVHFLIHLWWFVPSIHSRLGWCWGCVVLSLVLSTTGKLLQVGYRPMPVFGAVIIKALPKVVMIRAHPRSSLSALRAGGVPCLLGRC